MRKLFFVLAAILLAVSVWLWFESRTLTSTTQAPVSSSSNVDRVDTVPSNEGGQDEITKPKVNTQQDDSTTRQPLIAATTEAAVIAEQTVAAATDKADELPQTVTATSTPDPIKTVPEVESTETEQLINTRSVIKTADASSNNNLQIQELNRMTLFVSLLKQNVAAIKAASTNKTVKADAPSGVSGKAPVELEETLYVFSADAYRLRINGVDENVAKVLAKIAQQIETKTNHVVSVEGHTDNTPINPSAELSYADNQELSQLRAYAIATALVDLGVSSDAVKTLGLGDSAPVQSNATREGRLKNRRVEIKLLPASGQ